MNIFKYTEKSLKNYFIIELHSGVIPPSTKVNYHLSVQKVRLLYDPENKIIYCTI